MANKTSQHILGTSANLLGFCLFVMTALQFSNKRELTYLDEFTAAISILLAVSSVLSFFSLRKEDSELGERLETIADYIFMAALLGISVVIVFIALNFIG